jgi:hypothetical protein
MIDRAVVTAFVCEDRAEFHRLIGLKPWQASPLDVGRGASPWPAGAVGTASWQSAQAMRRELLSAARTMGIRQHGPRRP